MVDARRSIDTYARAPRARAEENRPNFREVHDMRGTTVAALLSALCLTAGFAPIARAEASISGHVSNVSFYRDYVLIQLDAGPPSSCVPNPSGWLRIPPENKPSIAFIIGLWMRGDASSTSVTVYSDGIDASGFCAISQIDPVG